MFNLIPFAYIFTFKARFTPIQLRHESQKYITKLIAKNAKLTFTPYLVKSEQ